MDSKYTPPLLRDQSRQTNAYHYVQAEQGNRNKSLVGTKGGEGHGANGPSSDIFQRQLWYSMRNVKLTALNFWGSLSSSIKEV